MVYPKNTTWLVKKTIKLGTVVSELQVKIFYAYIVID